MNIKSNYHRGLKAEKIARLWLQLKGYRILQQRYRNRYGEIDLIVCKGRRLAAVEIKCRQTLTQAAYCLNIHQRVRIERTLTTYISQLSWCPQEIRLDVVLVAPFCWPKHLKNAWQTRN